MAVENADVERARLDDQEDGFVAGGNGLDPEDPSPKQARRPLTFLNGLALVIGLQIGSGIFSSPSVVSSHVESPAAAILVWLFAGLLVWTGASTIAQLGSAMPQNGGIQDYLRHAYGDFFGFLFVWIWVFMAKPCANAMASFIFAEHFCKLVWGIEDPNNGLNTIVALISIAVITLINCRGAVSGARVANGFLALKLFTVASIVLSGLCFIGFAPLRSRDQANQKAPTLDPVTPDPNSRDGSLPDKSTQDYVSAVFGALFAYGGWENIGFLAGELQQVTRILPRIVNTAMVIAITCFVSLNLTLYAVLPIEVLRSTNKVAIVFGSKVLGKFGEDFYSILVSLSCLGSLNANTFTIGRLAYEAGRRSYLPKILGRSWRSTNSDTGTGGSSRALCGLLNRESSYVQWFIGSNDPNQDGINPVYAMIFNASITGIYILFGSFRGLVTFKGISEYSVYALTCLSALISHKSSDIEFSTLLADDAQAQTPAEQPYKTFVANPIIFLVVSTALVVRGIISEPWIGLGLASVVVVGRIAYYWKKPLAAE